MQYMLLIYLDEQALSEPSGSIVIRSRRSSRSSLAPPGNIWQLRPFTPRRQPPACGFATANGW